MRRPPETASIMQHVLPHPGLGFGAFVATVAIIQTTFSFAIDVMVPALGDISLSLHLGHGNARQWVIAVFVISFGISQLFYALIADQFGRKPILLLCMGVLSLSSFGAAIAPSFSLLLIARAVQGAASAGAKVMITACIRDCYAGRLMAKVNSLSFIVFLSAPIVAPWLGQQLLKVATWPFIFVALGIYAGFTALWVLWRLPETMRTEDRRSVTWIAFTAATQQTLRNRISLGYTLAGMCISSGWLGFIYSAQQVFADVFHALNLFPAVFAFCAVSMAIAALINSRLVERFGMRRLSHGAILGFITAAIVQTYAAFTGWDTLAHFALLQLAVMFGIGLLQGNFPALSMEPLGHIAGTAAAIQGFIIMSGSAFVGIFIGQQFDGTLRPLTLGFSLCGILCLSAILWAEKGRLFRAHVITTDLKTP